MPAIYLDHAATTPVAPAVLEAMLPYFTDVSANAGSLHGPGQAARAAVDASRRRIAHALGARPAEIVFTSGATEANNWALAGVAASRVSGHVVVSAIEHHAVLEPADALKRLGFELTVVPVDAQGRVDPDDVSSALRDDTILVSIMQANNEIGTIQPIADIARCAHARGVPVHTDATQTFGAIDVDVDALGVDLLSASAHKRYGPKGVGLLYVRQGTSLAPLLRGGAHERGRRAGTENVPGIVGFSRAIEIALAGRDEEARRVSSLRDRLEAGALTLGGARRNGGLAERLPGIASVSFAGCDSESLLMALDLRGIAASSGSACTAGSLEVSHVLKAVGLSKEEAAGTVRFSLGRHTSEADVEETLAALREIVPSMRSAHARAPAPTLR
jgi:cysteine desulfurase